jgi:hypothetical protein
VGTLELEGHAGACVLQVSTADVRVLGAKPGAAPLCVQAMDAGVRLAAVCGRRAAVVQGRRVVMLEAVGSAERTTLLRVADCTLTQEAASIALTERHVLCGLWVENRVSVRAAGGAMQELATLPTHSPPRALALVALAEGQTYLLAGCADGRVVVAPARASPPAGEPSIELGAATAFTVGNTEVAFTVLEPLEFRWPYVLCSSSRSVVVFFHNALHAVPISTNPAFEMHAVGVSEGGGVL